MCWMAATEFSCMVQNLDFCSVHNIYRWNVPAHTTARPLYSVIPECRECSILYSIFPMGLHQIQIAPHCVPKYFSLSSNSNLRCHKDDYKWSCQASNNLTLIKADALAEPDTFQKKSLNWTANCMCRVSTGAVKVQNSIDGGVESVKGWWGKSGWMKDCSVRDDGECMAVPGNDDSLVHNGLLFVNWLPASHS